MRFPNGSALQIDQLSSHAKKPQSEDAYEEPTETEAVTTTTYTTTTDPELTPTPAAPGFNQASASAVVFPVETADANQLASGNPTSNNDNTAVTSTDKKPPDTGAGACLAPNRGYGLGLLLVALWWAVNF